MYFGPTWQAHAKQIRDEYKKVFRDCVTNSEYYRANSLDVVQFDAKNRAPNRNVLVEAYMPRLRLPSPGSCLLILIFLFSALAGIAQTATLLRGSTESG